MYGYLSYLPFLARGLVVGVGGIWVDALWLCVNLVVLIHDAATRLGWMAASFQLLDASIVCMYV